MALHAFQTPPRILSGPGAAQNLDEALAPLGAAARVLIVTDKGVRGAGLLDAPLEALAAAGRQTHIYDDVVADPPVATVLDAVMAATSFEPDLIIGFGGGSSMDVAKLIAVLLHTDQKLEDMYGVGAVTGARTTPLVQIPTTAGTGSEATPISIVTTGETTKTGIVAPQLYADLIILDAALTTGLPKHVTAATGVDAMVHAIEAFTTKRLKNPISDALAKEALRLLWSNIKTACTDGANLEARSAMLLGACFAGQAFANAPVAAVHALAYPLGGIFHVPHGLSNALVLAPVLRFNAAAAEEQYAELADIICPGASGSAGARTQAMIEALQAMTEEIGLEQKLTQIGVNHTDLPRLAEDAMKQTRLLINNPRDVSYDDALAIYTSIL